MGDVETRDTRRYVEGLRAARAGEPVELGDVPDEERSVQFESGVDYAVRELEAVARAFGRGRRTTIQVTVVDDADAIVPRRYSRGGAVWHES